MSEVLWTSEAAAVATGGRAQGSWRVRGLSIDSRTLKAGEMFVALQHRRDGHRFIAEALAAGAGAVMVCRPVDHGHPALIVEDTLEALEDLAVCARDRCEGLRVAITGSAGKTSVKEMLAQVFLASGRAHWSQKSFNNQWGVPLSVASMPVSTRRAVFEVGMNTPGEIEPRARMIAPHMAAVTCIAGAHLEGLGSLDKIAEEKAQIFSGLLPDGVAMIPGDDCFADYLELLLRRFCPEAGVVRFGSDSEHEAYFADMKAESGGGLYHLRIDGREVRVFMRAQGWHWGLNAALVFALAHRAGIELSEIADSLEGFEPLAGRGRAESISLSGGGEAILLDDAYNANPHSMEAAFSSLGFHAGRKLAILGEMRELGTDSGSLHAGLAGPVRESGISCLFLVGERMRELARELAGSGIEVFHVLRSDSLVDVVMEKLSAGDILLVKGSQASGMDRIAGQISANCSGRVRHGG